MLWTCHLTLTLAFGIVIASAHWVEPSIRMWKKLCWLICSKTKEKSIHKVYSFEKCSFAWISAAYLQICQKVDANLTECLKESIEKFRSVLIDGIPNVDVPSLDPLEIGHLYKSEKKKHGVRIKTENVVVLGILKFTIDDLKWVDFLIFNISIVSNQFMFENGFS